MINFLRRIFGMELKHHYYMVSYLQKIDGKVVWFGKQIIDSPDKITNQDSINILVKLKNSLGERKGFSNSSIYYLGFFTETFFSKYYRKNPEDEPR